MTTLTPVLRERALDAVRPLQLGRVAEPEDVVGAAFDRDAQMAVLGRGGVLDHAIGELVHIDKERVQLIDGAVGPSPEHAAAPAGAQAGVDPAELRLEQFVVIPELEQLRIRVLEDLQARESAGVGVVHGDEGVVVQRSGHGDQPLGHGGVPAGRRAGHHLACADQ